MTDLRPQTAREGPTLGRYHLAEAIGGGPTGEVFRAKVYGVAGFERQFAVKRFWKQLCEEPSRQAALAEAARRYQTIEHPRIARLHEYGVVDGQAFVAVELVPGVDLARFIAFTHGLGQPVPAGAAMAMLAQLARAVAYAQGRGVPHIGICPTNVVCTPDGDVKVMDFGLLRARLGEKPGEDWSLTARLPYLAPEQLRGGLATPATDVFQLATLAFELLTGKRAFDGNAPQEIAAAVAAAQVPPELLPPGVADVLARAHAPRPEDRWSNAGAFADYLEAAMRKSPQPGGRSDVAAAVRRAMQKVAEMEAHQISGALSFPLPSPPPSLQGLAPIAAEPEPRAQSQTTVAEVNEPRVELAGADSGESTYAGETIPGPRAVAANTPSVPDLPALAGDDDDEPQTDLHVPMSATGATPIVSTSAPPEPPPAVVSAPPEPPPLQMSAPPPLRKRGQGMKRALLVIVLLGAAGGGGWYAFQRATATEVAESKPEAKDEPVAVKEKPVPVKEKPVPVKEKPVVVADAGTPAIAVAAPDAAAVEAPPAAPDAGVSASPPVAEGTLRFESTPKGASVYLDGALKGKTPLELPASADKHKVALILRGYKLHRVDVDGGGLVKVDLVAVEPFEGDGRIKVRCKTKNRLYIIVDGQDTGELCPSERIYTKLGAVTLELYDPVNDTTNSHQVQVKPSKGSQRVRLPD